MGRGVSTPTKAVECVFIEPSIEEDYCNDWNDFIEDVRGVVLARYPSFDDCDRWLDREDRAVLENGHAYVTVSEYCGTVAICLVPKETDTPELALAWCEQIAARWQEHIESRYSSAMRRIGTMSNGVSVYRKV